jgi:hypothetical protein
MKLTKDTRGVSEVVGAILVFGVLVALLAIMQTQAVPAANEQVEFEHSQEVQGDFADFHAAANDVATDGDRESVSIAAGTGYPTRMLFYNPPRVQGSISTSENRTVTISNAEAVDPEVHDYLNGDPVSVGSRTLRYDVSYNELENPPQVRYEYGILYNQFRGDVTIQNPGSVIDDTEINLVFMAGNYSRTTGDTQSLEVRPVSAPSRPVTVQGENGDNITLTLPTELPVEDWQEQYGDQSHVTITNATGDNIKIELDGNRRYTLKMAGIGLEQGVDKPDAHYIVPVDDGVDSIGAGDNATVSYEVRDVYNTPVSGVNVSISGGRKKATDGNGRVSFRVNPGQPQTFTGEIEDCGTSERCRADYRVQVTDLNPNPASGVTLEGASTQEVDIPGLDIQVGDSNLAFELEAEDGPVAMSRLRINHYHSNPEAHNPVDLSDGNTTMNDLQISGNFVDVDENFAEVEESGTQYVFTFSDDVNEDDYVVVTIIFEDGQRRLFFISPSASAF